MRHASVAVAVVVGLVVAGCSSKPDAPPAESSTTTAEQAAASDGGPVRDAFEAANKTAPWFGQVSSVKLDGKGIVVLTTLTDADTDTALAVCEAAYSAGETSGVDFVSVGVRTADGGSTLASRNKLAGHVSCQA